MRTAHLGSCRNVELSFRHDVRGTDWAWGTSAMHGQQAMNFRLGETSLSAEGPVLGSIFAEHKNLLGLTVRGTLGNIFQGANTLERVVFAGRRTGPISFTEQRRREIGPIFSFSVSGSF